MNGMIVQDMSNDKIYAEAKEHADEVYKYPCEAKQLLIVDEYKHIKHDAIMQQIEDEKAAIKAIQRENIQSNKLDTK